MTNNTLRDTGIKFIESQRRTTYNTAMGTKSAGDNAIINNKAFSQNNTNLFKPAKHIKQTTINEKTSTSDAWKNLSQSPISSPAQNPVQNPIQSTAQAPMQETVQNTAQPVATDDPWKKLSQNTSQQSQAPRKSRYNNDSTFELFKERIKWLFIIIFCLFFFSEEILNILSSLFVETTPESANIIPKVPDSLLEKF